MANDQKQENENQKGLKVLDNAKMLPQPVIESNERRKQLKTNVVKAINETANTNPGKLTINEIVDTLLDITHAYNKMSLDAQHAKQLQDLQQKP